MFEDLRLPWYSLYSSYQSSILRFHAKFCCIIYMHRSGYLDYDLALLWESCNSKTRIYKMHIRKQVRSCPIMCTQHSIASSNVPTHGRQFSPPLPVSNQNASRMRRQQSRIVATVPNRGLGSVQPIWLWSKHLICALPCGEGIECRKEEDSKYIQVSIIHKFLTPLNADPLILISVHTKHNNFSYSLCSPE